MINLICIHNYTYIYPRDKLAQHSLPAIGPLAVACRGSGDDLQPSDGALVSSDNSGLPGTIT